MLDKSFYIVLFNQISKLCFAIFIIFIVLIVIPERVATFFYIDNVREMYRDEIGISIIVSLIFGFHHITQIIKRKLRKLSLRAQEKEWLDALRLELQSLSYGEAAILLVAISYNSKSVYAPMDDASAQSLANKGIVRGVSGVYNPSRAAYIINSSVWEILMSTKDDFSAKYGTKNGVMILTDRYEMLQQDTDRLTRRW